MWWNIGILTFNPLTWKIWWAHNNASRWQMGLNSAFKRLIPGVQRFLCSFSIQIYSQRFPFLPAELYAGYLNTEIIHKLTMAHQQYAQFLITDCGKYSYWIHHHHHHHHHHVPEGLGMLSCSLILKMKLVTPSLPRSSYVSSSFWFIL